MKILRRIGFAILLTLLLVIAVMQSPFVKNYAVDTFKSSLKEKTGLDVEIDHASLFLPFRGTAYGITLKDSAETLATMESLSFRISWLTFIKNDLHIDGLQISQLKLGPDLPPMNLDAKIQIHPQRKICHIRTSLQNGKDPQGITLLDLFGRLHGDEATAIIKIKEQPEGYFSQIMDLPYGYAAKLRGTLTGPIKSWKEWIAKEPIGSPLTGEMNLSYELKETAPEIITKISEHGSWEGTFSLAQKPLLQFHQLSGHSGIFEATGHCHLSKELQLDHTLLQVKCIDLKKLHPILTGTASAKVVADGSLFAPYVSIIANSPEIQVQKRILNDIKAEASLTYNNETFAGEATFAANDIAAAGSYRWKDKLELEDISLESAGTRVLGACTFDPYSWSSTGSIRCSSTELGRWTPLKGEGTATLNLAHTGEEGQKLELDLALVQSHYNDIAFAEGKAHASFTQLWSAPSGHLSVEAHHLDQGGLHLESFHAATTVKPNEKWPFELKTLGSLRGDLAIDASGDWSLDSLDISKLDGMITGHPFALKEHVHGKLADNRWVLSPLFFDFGKGSAYLSVDNTAETLHTIVRIQKAPIAPLCLLLPSLSATGVVDADLYLFGEPENLHGQLTAKCEEMQIHEEAFESLPPFEGTLRASLLNNTLDCRSKILNISDQPIELKANIPVTCSISPPGIRLEENLPVYTELNASGPIAPFLQLFSVDVPNFGGQAEMALQVEGTLQNPKISGEANISHGHYESLESGAQLEEISAHIVGDGHQLVLQSFEGKCGKAGVFKGNGAVQLDRTLHFPFTIDGTLKDALLVNNKNAAVTTSGDIRFRGNFHEAKLEGTLVANSASITIPEEQISSVPKVEVSYTHQPDEERAPTQYVEKPPSWPIFLDLNVETEKRIAIKDDALNSEWKGKAVIKGCAHAPLIDGDLKLSKGSYRFRGRDLKLEEGSISFQDSPFEKGKLYIVASMDIKDIVVEVVFKGEMDDPSLSFRSNPPLSQREILSRMIFNKSLSDITPFQSKEIAQSIKNLNKPSLGKDPFSQLQQNIGIDRIDISPTDVKGTPDVAVELGKYITDSTVLIVRKNINTEGNQVGIETALTDRIKLQAEISNDKTGHVNLLWKNDY